MRRTLSDSTFLRVYVLLLMALVLTFGLALLGFLVVDQVRQENYRERLASGPMQVLAELVAEQPDAKCDEWLASMSATLGVSMTLHPLDDGSLSYFDRSRLAEGRPLIERHDGQWLALQRLPNAPRLLEVRVDGLQEMQLRGATEALRTWLSGVPEDQSAARLARLQHAFKIPLEVSLTLPPGIDPIQRARLEGGEVVVRLEPGRGVLYVHARLGADRWLTIGPIPSFEPMPISLALALLSIMLLVLAGTIYFVVRGVEGRVERLERAATRIAGGHLDTRVRVESSDFLGRLGMAFNGMAAQVQSLLRTQQEMIRAVSHELRTPVARIRFAVQMVEDMTDEPVVRRQLQDIDGDIEELDQLVDEILTYARLGSDTAQGIQLATETTDCRAMAHRVVDTLAPLHAHLRLQVLEGDDVDVEADSRYLQRALSNLVANACRHAEGHVQVSVTREARAVRLDVEDDGAGVPEADRLLIFKPFARLDDSRTRRSGGYGLGLSIVQKIMVWHGGSVVVERSQRLGGARFSLLLPTQDMLQGEPRHARTRHPGDA
ncbi:two-component system sensor histidine kinase RstB [Chromohalobacter marismortui]|uniref:histidine kinase n=1 Tax=Chromohalobacter marismortui TaxID=42055 RepID=A0A4R7NSP2_9GAMM|nr:MULTISPECIES: ATP-binding protein [Chromohalobacter]MCI0509160.1 ATP-binding protein [Chromohalobacter sp.]MCI0592036.1 ATP-binding protein [Chromohalobacter sp.]TDU23947.1 two-component system sensor histidine kinase RstB [Chromohalobacter marismortui]